MSQQQNPIERAVDLFVFAPIGVACFAKDTVPTFLKMFVARGQTELQHRHKLLTDQANQYKTVGQFAVKYGGPEVRRAAEARLDGVRRRGEEVLATVPVRTPGRAASTNGSADSQPAPNQKPAAPPVPAPATPAPRASTTPPVSSLVIPEYDELSASQVVERLEGLATEELDAVREYETAHRARNTILGKIDQLTH